MAAKRCSNCNLDWPSLAKFQQCLVCGEETWWDSTAEPMTIPEATRMERFGEFERFYEAREQERMREPGYVPPERDPRLRSMSWQEIVVASTPVPDAPPA